MKKVLSLLMVSAVLIGMLGLPVVSADETTKSPVFTMDLSEYSAENQVVKNGVTGSSDGIKISKKIRTLADERSGPALKQDVTTNGEKISYLAFSDTTVPDKDQSGTLDYAKFLGSVYIENDKMGELLNGSSDMTVEFWAKSNPTAYDYFRAFNYASDNTNANRDMYTQFYTTAATPYVKLGAASYKTSKEETASSYDLAGTTGLKNDVWRYYAVSKQWKQTADDGKGTWTYIIVVDDTVLTYESGQTAKEKTDVYKNDNMTANIMSIGGQIHPTLWSVFDPFDGAIASFNIYNTMLSADELKANYNAEKDLYASVLEMGSTMTCTNETTKTVTSKSGSMELTFDNYVDSATLEGIVMQDAAGNTVNTVKKLKDEGYSKTVVITWPQLTGASYTVKVTSTLKSVNGIAATAKDIILTVSDEKDYIVNEDFTGDTHVLTAVSNKAASTNIEHDKTNGWVTISNPTDAIADAMAAVYFGGDENNKKTIRNKNIAVVVSMKVGEAAAGDRELRFYAFNKNGGEEALVGKLGTYFPLYNLGLSKPYGGSDLTVSETKISQEKDANDFVTARFTFTADPNHMDGSYKTLDVAVRNMLDDKTDGISMHTAETGWTGLGWLTFKGYEKANGASSFTIDKVQAWYVDDFKVLSSGVSADGQNYEIVMNDDLHENYALNGLPLTVGSATVNATVSGNVISIPMASLAGGISTVSLEGVLSAQDVYCYDSVDVTKDGVTFTNTDSDVITSFDDSTGVVTATVAGAPAGAVTYLVLYDEDGRVQSLTTQNQIEIPNTVTTGWKVKCIVLESAASLKPVFKSAETTLAYCL